MSKNEELKREKEFSERQRELEDIKKIVFPFIEATSLPRALKNILIKKHTRIIALFDEANEKYGKDPSLPDRGITKEAGEEICTLIQEAEQIL